MNRVVLASVAALVVVLASVAPVAAAVDAGASSDTDPGGPLASGVSGGTLAMQDNSASNNTTTTPTTTTASGSGGRPDASTTVRILPVQVDSNLVSATTHKQGAAYNTSGPFAFFSLSEPVDEAAIQQSGATATVLSGGRTIKIQYAKDAAPVGKTSLYNLQLWFPDGSTKTVDLYASETSKTASESNLKKYRPELLEMLEDAESAGYERSPDGLEAYYTDTKETAELLDSLLSEQAARLFATIIAFFRNPLGMLTGVVAIVLVSAYMLRKNRSVLDYISNDSGKWARLRKEFEIKYREQQQSAADRELRDVDGIGQYAAYWDDAYNITTVAELCELFRGNYPAVDGDGNRDRIGGVDALDPENINQSWLEPVCRANRLPSPEIALSHGKKALEEAKHTYAMHWYGDPLADTRALLDELDESRDYTRFTGHRDTSTGGMGSPGPTGGDD